MNDILFVSRPLDHSTWKKIIGHYKNPYFGFLKTIIVHCLKVIGVAWKREIYMTDQVTML
jgi:hypothetical protein